MLPPKPGSSAGKQVGGLVTHLHRRIYSSSFAPARRTQPEARSPQQPHHPPPNQTGGF
jgi:hypothetical protein